jgi:ABC-2 type transport system permease protein
MWILLGRLVESDDVVEFLLIGQIAVVGPQFTGWTIQAFTWDRMFRGTYPMLIASPSSLVPTMLGRTSIWLLNGIATALVTLAALTPVFGLVLGPSETLGAIAILACICVSTYGLAFFVGALVNWAPRLRNVLHNLMFIGISAICGVVVPTSFWSGWVQGIASILPVTHGLHALRALIAGGPRGPVGADVALELVVGLSWFLLGVLALDRTVENARRTGTVEFV